jgi:FAD/FMN-containing dehydrogenase
MAILEQTALGRFQERFRGQVIRPEDAAFDEARTVFNAMIDRRPAVIAQCTSTQDVVEAIRFARDSGLEIAVRGGGHSVAGKALSEGGLVLDLRRMNGVTVDPEARTAVVGGGATMSNLDRGTGAYGLATTGGRVSTTGVGGFTLGGGGGWLDRKFGLACDNLVAAEIVTADGQVVTASETEHPDLFWALHGGGGTFGVATSLTLTLHPLGPVTAMLLLWPAEEGPRVIRAYRDFIEQAGDDIGGGSIYLTGPELDFVPAEMVGKLSFAMLVTYAGPEEAGRKAAAPMLALGHKGEMIAEMPYAELQCMLDDPPGFRNYWSAEYLDALPDAAIDVFSSKADSLIVPSPSQHVLFPGGGAVARETADWPVPWRHAPWCVHPFGLWIDPADDARGIAWVRGLREAMQPWATGATYLNFIGDEGEERIVAGLGRENYKRLARIKTEYDPENVFHLNQNIKPA